MQQEFYTVASSPPLNLGLQPSLQVLFAGESQTKPGHRLGPKVYDFYLMHIVLSGEGTFTLEGVKHQLGAGQTFLIKPEQLISYESNAASPWRYRWIAFRGSEASELASLAGFHDETQIIMLEQRRRAQLLYYQIYQAFRGGRPSASLEATGLFHLLMACYSRMAASPIEEELMHGRLHGEGDQLHQRVVHYLSTQYTHPVSIEQMAESLGYNRAYLSRIFKERTGLSPISFLLRLRLDKAKLLLREKPHLTIEQTAASVGIQDALYFSKQFRNVYGISPTAYRKERRMS
ncbi:AraC family transcriptional regulator [Paenibacillus sp. HB172176]|uniref:AraC family transcriptional regulator n=1 Tax=Paenibacillus sp. HB172176 TaxID=2493690 RepID=UPI001438F176|nr:AraC family transcriptional regulator [Paenibacillus sp. HB172176]